MRPPFMDLLHAPDDAYQKGLYRRRPLVPFGRAPWLCSHATRRHRWPHPVGHCHVAVGLQLHQALTGASAHHGMASPGLLGFQGLEVMQDFQLQRPPWALLGVSEAAGRAYSPEPEWYLGAYIPLMMELESL